jgi:hypothetical protein
VFVLLGMIFVKVVIYFYSTRVAIIKNLKSKGGKGYKKSNFNFLFLSEKNHCTSYYSHHQLILNMIKDPILAVILVFFSEYPGIQIGGAFVITLLFFFLEFFDRPSLDKAENVRNMISNGIYALINLIFFILHLTEGSISESVKENFIGWPLIASVTLLIVSNYYISMREAWRGLKKKCKKW